MGPDYDVSGTSTTTYDSYLSMPADMDVGDTWGGTVTGTSALDGEVVNEFSYTYSARVTGTERVTVPAGTFDTLVISTTTEGNTSRQWVAEGIGGVKSDGSELISYAP